MAGRAPSSHRRARSRPGLRFAVVAGRFNESITKRLLDGALHALDAAGVAEKDLEVHWVPGAFELPQAALHLARTRRFAAIVCVGCVIRGQTPHFDFVAGQAAAGIPRGGLATRAPPPLWGATAPPEAPAAGRAGGARANPRSE